MKKVNHVNYADVAGNVYCHLLKKVVTLDEKHQNNFCSQCPMFRGSAQGQGVECEWSDVRDVQNPHVVQNPYIEVAHVLTSEAVERQKERDKEK